MRSSVSSAIRRRSARGMRRSMPKATFCSAVMWGNNASDWNTYDRRRAAIPSDMRRVLSNQTSVPRAIRPLSGRTSPAIAASVVLLPAPEWPNRIVIPGGTSNAASSSNWPHVPIASWILTWPTWWTSASSAAGRADRTAAANSAAAIGELEILVDLVNVGEIGHGPAATEARRR